MESLDGSAVLADHRSNVAFNPASVIKIATSFAALDKLGPDYHFETTFEAAGEIKRRPGRLKETWCWLRPEIRSCQPWT